MPPYAYICAGNEPFGVFGSDNSLTIIDLANPLAPTFVGNIQGAGAPPGGNYLESPTRVAIKDNYAYVCAYNEDRFTVIDITNPAAPVFAASLNVPGLYDIKISGNYAFVVTRWMNQLISIDISNPLAPAIADTVVHGWGTPTAVYIQGDRAYVGAVDSTLHIFDISDPTAIAFLGEAVVATGGAVYVIVDGNTAYVSDSNDWLRVVDVTNPVLIAVLGSIGTAGAPNHMDNPVGLYKVGNLVYVCAWGEWYLNIVDVTNPAVPVIVGQLDIQAAMGGSPRPREVYVRDNYAYVTEGNQVPEDGLLTIDISNPVAPFLAGTIQGSGAPNFLENAYGLFIRPLSTPLVQTLPATGVT